MKTKITAIVLLMTALSGKTQNDLMYITVNAIQQKNPFISPEERNIFSAKTPDLWPSFTSEERRLIINFLNYSISGPSTSDTRAWASDPIWRTGTMSQMQALLVERAKLAEPLFWSGNVSYRVSGPATFTGDIVPATFQNQPTGIYRISYLSGGPPDSSFAGTDGALYLQNGVPIIFTLHFQIFPEWRRVIETQPAQPTYGDCPVKEPGKENLVVVTHGWQLFPLPRDVSFVDTMSNIISGYLTSHRLTNWQVFGYKWVDNAWTFFPTHALNNAKQEGWKLGNCISAQGWSHVHLIGHSVGAEVIQEASQWIKASGTTVHCTFLDAYVGKRYEKVEAYGVGTDWSDSYFSRDALTRFGSIATGPFTESPLDHAYNVDVTWLDPHKIIGTKFRSSATGEMEPCIKTLPSHGWPIDFYVNTITGNTNSDYAGFGFQLSKEGGNWDYATNNYAPGNGTIGNPVPTRVLGPPDPACITEIQLTPRVWPDWLADFATWPTVQSASGSVQKGNGWTILNPGSPVWLVMFVNPTNPLNTISFDAMFVSTNGLDSFLSVYWETNVIGTVDKLYVQPGFQHYSLSFPQATANSMHVFGLRLDPFTNAPSSVILTNVVFTQIGVSQPFSLSVVTNTSSELLVYELVGEPGFEYNVQASTNLLDWTDIAILANINGTVRFFDEASTNYSKRYYRAVAPY